MFASTVVKILPALALLITASVALVPTEDESVILDALAIGEPCNETAGDICADTLYCLYQTCSCATGDGFEWDEELQRCVGRVGAACEANSDCVKNSTCTDLFCACGAGFSPTRDRHCAKSFGQNCQAPEECNQDALLTCTENNACRCADETGNLHDDAIGFCVARVGETCDPYTDYFGFPNGDSGKKCHSSAICERDASTYVCQCPEGTLVTAGKTCESGTVRLAVPGSLWVLLVLVMSLRWSDSH